MSQLPASKKTEKSGIEVFLIESSVCGLLWGERLFHHEKWLGFMWQFLWESQPFGML